MGYLQGMSMGGRSGGCSGTARRRNPRGCRCVTSVIPNRLNVRFCLVSGMSDPPSPHLPPPPPASPHPLLPPTAFLIQRTSNQVTPTTSNMFALTQDATQVPQPAFGLLIGVLCCVRVVVGCDLVVGDFRWCR